MLKFYEFYHPKGFEIVGFSADTDRDDLVNFLKEKKLPWNHGLRQGRSERDSGILRHHGLSDDAVPR